MHQADTRPRQSIYHHYQVYPAAPIPPAASDGAAAPVVVVGAGPIGLALALDLARHGVRCVVLEAEQQVSEGSRAIVFTRRSMEILQQVGADAAITARGLPWRFGNSFYAGQRVFRMEAPHDDNDRFWPMINLQQPIVEEALLALVAAQPLIELRWGHKVVGLPQAGGDLNPIADDKDEFNRGNANAGAGAELEIDTPQGLYRQRASWVVASDGARSALRQLQGLRLEGDAYEGRFVIADIRIALPLPTERLAFFDPDWNPGNTALMHREPGGIWRIDYQLPPGETPEQALAPESLRLRIDSQLALVGAAGLPWELDWSSVYSTRAMTLPDYVVGRVCYAGDAAHLLPIFGVRGANTGWQDGQGLAWRLALVVKGLAGPGLLASYSQERVAAAREIISEAGKSTRFMTPPSVGFRLLRDAVLSLSLSEEFVRPLFHWRTSRPHEYRDSELNSRQDDSLLFNAGPAAGAAMRNVRLGADGYLMDSVFAGFQLMYFGDGAELPGDVLASVSAWRARGVSIQVIAVHRGESEAGIDNSLSTTGDKFPLRNDFTASPVPREIAAQREPADAREIADPAGRVWSTYGVSRSGAAYLIRPDQHVCARWQTLQGDRLDAAMRQALGMGSEQGLPGFKSAVGVEKLSPDAALAAIHSTASRTQSATDAKQALTLPGLEQVYDSLAQALSQTPQRERFLVKLALLLAQECGDADRVGSAIESAARDLSRAAD